MKNIKKNKKGGIKTKKVKEGLDRLLFILGIIALILLAYGIIKIFI